MSQKRSKSISWTPAKGVGFAKPLMVSVAAVSLVGCGEDEEPAQLVTSLQDCLDKNYWSQDVCEAAYAQALAEAEEGAPRYPNEALCENDFGFGNCDASDGNNWFYPAMTGFLLAEVIDEVGDLYKKKKRAKAVYSYRNSSGSGLVTTAAASSMFKRQSYNAYEKTNKQTTSPAVSRSGFGASAGRATSSLGG